MADESDSVANKSLRLQQIDVYKLIVSAAEIYGWHQIQMQKKQINMLSFQCLNQRINVWIKQNQKISVRIQPLEYVRKDVRISNFMNILKDCHEVIENETYYCYKDEGQ